VWAHLLGQARAERQGDFLEQLQSRKAQIGEALDKWEGGAAFRGRRDLSRAAAGRRGWQYRRRTAAEAATPRVGPEGEKEPADYASRLLRAKKRAMEERDKDKP